MSNLCERIKLVIDREQITARELERRLGASDGVISKHLRDGSDIKPQWIMKLSEVFPIYNRDWLLTGEGEPLKTTTGEQKEGGIFVPAELVQMFGDMAATIRSQQETIKMLASTAEKVEQKNAAGL